MADLNPNETTETKVEDLSWYQNQLTKAFNFFLTPASVVPPDSVPPVVPTAAPPASPVVPSVVPPDSAPPVVPPDSAPPVVPPDSAPPVEPVEPVPPVLPAVGSGEGDAEDGFSRDEFVRLHNQKPGKFAQEYAAKYPKEVAKQLLQSISFE